jgi:hypothetical protein
MTEFGRSERIDEIFGTPDQLAAAHATGVFVIGHEIARHNQLEGREIAGYADCQAEHAKLMIEFSEAETALLNAARVKITEDTGLQEHLSWHWRSVPKPGNDAVESKKVIELLHEVRIYTSGGELLDSNSGAMNIRTHIIHRPATLKDIEMQVLHANGLMVGGIVLEENAIRTGLKLEDLRPKNFATLDRSIRQELSRDVRQEALKDLAVEYLALEGYDITHYAAGLSSEMRKILVDDFSSGDKALDALIRAFDESTFAELRDILRTSDESWRGILRSVPGVAQRIAWLRSKLELAPGIWKDSRNQIIFGFADRFRQRLAEEHKKIETLRDIAGVLRQTTQVEAPSKELPAVLRD